MPRRPPLASTGAALTLACAGVLVTLALAATPAPSAPAVLPAVPVQVAPAGFPVKPASPPLPRALTLRWAVPEPRLVGGRIERPLLSREVTLTLGAAQAALVVKEQSPKRVRAALDAIYAGIESRTPRDVHFMPVGSGWIGEATTGWVVDRSASDAALLAALSQGARSSRLTIRLRAPPRSVRWAAAQGLTLLGSGESEFTGSPDFRVHNIRVGAARVHGAWVAPGKAFSFNALIGPITAATGFRPGYVVTGTTLSTEDGGGLCQVSTTVFRAAFAAGLPITERHAHSYQVAYYGPPGLDAAVYAPGKDLRWRNDTAAPILVQAGWDLARARLKVSVFGRPDGRRVEVAPPVITNRRPAAEPSFVADRALPTGGARRLDMPAEGLRAIVTRTVTFPDGRRRTQALVSRYRAWGGVFAVAPGDGRLK